MRLTVYPVALQCCERFKILLSPKVKNIMQILGFDKNDNDSSDNIDDYDYRRS